MKTRILIIGAAIGVLVGLLSGCAVVRDLDPKTVKALKRTAMRVGTEIVVSEIQTILAERERNSR